MPPFSRFLRIVFNMADEGGGGGDTAPVSAVASSVLDATPVTDPAAPVDPAKPADPAAPVEPAKPAEPPAPVEPLKPEDYKLDGLPEGITADDDLVKAFLDGAAKGGMDNDSVNAVLQTLGPKVAERMNAGVTAFKEINDKWAADALADPVIGGSTEKLQASVATIKTAINGLGLPAEMVTSALQAFQFTGAGNNPAVLRVFHAMASRLTEKPPVSGTPAQAMDLASVAQRFYPNTKPSGG